MQSDNPSGRKTVTHRKTETHTETQTHLNFIKIDICTCFFISMKLISMAKLENFFENKHGLSMAKLDFEKK